MVATDRLLEAPPVLLSAREMRQELLMCSESPAYFIDTYVHIYDVDEREWVPFRLWPAQVRALRSMHEHNLLVILKARQLGLTWLALGYILWLMLFRPVAVALLFSRRDDEAQHLLWRLSGMYRRLPEWVYARGVLTDNAHEWELSNGSMAHAFPTSAGDSYTATIALADEFDLVEDQGRLINAVKPTVERGKMILLSRADKKRPNTEFKKTYLGAKEGGAGEDSTGWYPIFMPWHARPDRTPAWYEAQKREALVRTGGLDDVYEQYPATDAEALAPPSLDKRLPAEWLLQCLDKRKPLARLPVKAPSLPGFEMYREPEPGRQYVIGGDPAEGNPTSDESAFCVLDRETGEEIAHYAGRSEPTVFASYMREAARYYDKAGVLPERNNHGHAVIAWWADNARDVPLLAGTDGKPGWLTTSASKAMMYVETADAFREGDTTLHSMGTYVQLASIEAGTLKAPEGEPDDRATAYALALAARARRVYVPGKPVTGAVRQPPAVPPGFR